MAKQNMSESTPEFPYPDHETFTPQVQDAGLSQVPQDLPDHLKNAQIRTGKLDRSYKQELSTVAHADIFLPSGGKVYHPSSVLSKGSLKVKFMTGRHEDILTSPSYYEKDSTFTVLLNELVLDVGFNANELTVFDRASVVMQIRMQNLGAEYKFDNPPLCESCKTPIEMINLSEVKDVNFRVPENLEDPVFPFQIEISKGVVHTIYLKHATIKDTTDLGKYIDRGRAKNEVHMITASQALYIDRVDRTDRPPITSKHPFDSKVAYCEDLPLKLNRALRAEIETLVDEPLPVVQHSCEAVGCGHINEIRIPTLDIGFFFPS